MTDGVANQVALITPALGTPAGAANQVALIIVSNDVPPPAAGATINQVAIISVGQEFVIPIQLKGFLSGGAVQGFPYLIER